MVKEYGSIDYIDFSPVEPNYFAVTCSVRVQIYNPITKLVAANLSKFQENAYGGSFRRDGRLLVAGDDGNNVKLFDTASKHMLRSFKGHKAPVHRTFFTSDMVHIASFSDDKTVKLWDIPTEKSICSFSEHEDYIRAGCTSPVSPNIFLSGGYDNLVKMYDSRTKSSAFSVDHGCPVESLLFLPSGGIFLSAGGTEIKVWDALAGGKLIAKISQHHKTVTCLRLASNGKRILSGSLDRHVKIYDIATYQVVHNIDLPNSVLSLGISSNDDTLVVGMVDGLFSIYRRDEETEVVEKKEKKPIAQVNNEEFDEIIEEYNRGTEPRHDKCLRKFEYSKALDYVLLKYCMNKTPHVTVALIQELIRRKGLARAFAGRTHQSIATILQFIHRYLGDERFTKVLNDATHILLDVYEDDFDKFTGEIGKSFIDLAKKLKREEELTYECLELQGALELLTAGATITSSEAEFGEDFKNIKYQQSERAKNQSVINVL